VRERGAGPGARSVPFNNPHLQGWSEERLSVQRRHFERLLSLVPFYSVNTEAAAASEIERHLCDILAGQKVTA